MQYHQGTQISPAIAKIMADKRDSKRVRSVFSASAHVNGEFFAHCVIKDVSSTGMKLQFQQPYDLPETFEIKTPAISESVFVRRAWVNGADCGVEFDEVEEPQS